MISHFWTFLVGRVQPWKPISVMQTKNFKDLKIYSFHMKTCEIGLICFKNLVKLLFDISRKR